MNFPQIAAGDTWISDLPMYDNDGTLDWTTVTYIASYFVVVVRTNSTLYKYGDSGLTFFTYFKIADLIFTHLK